MDAGELRPRFSKRRQPDALERFGQNLAVRASVRSGGVALLAATLLYGLVAGGHLGPTSRITQFVAQSSGLVGYSARHIVFRGLTRETPQAVMAILGLERGSSLIGFSPEQAQARLENVDWVASASVRFTFPNRLEIG